MHLSGDLPSHHFHLHSTNAVKSFAAHSLRQRDWEGLEQPFPEEVSLEFYGFGKRFHFIKMQLMTHLMVPGSKTTVHDAINGKTIVVPNVLQSYSYSDPERKFQATVTLHKDGLFHALIHEYDVNGVLIDTYQVSPVREHSIHFGSSHAKEYEALSAEAEHNMVMFKYSDLDEIGVAHQCASAQEHIDEKGKKVMKVREETMNVRSQTRKLLLDPGVDVTKWDK